ncbi:MAG: glycosyltransferase family 39 protein, partial [Anaerolineae bacterium]
MLVGLALRCVPLGRYVTPDEPNWVYRSIGFGDALAAGDWSAIPPTGHPGVTTMWLGAAGIFAQRRLNPAESARHLDWIRRLAWLDPESGEAFRHLGFFLSAGRMAVVLVNALTLGILGLMLSRLFDRLTALIGVGLLALDPYLIGHSGLLHTDALLANLTLLGLVGALIGLQEPRRTVWWPLVGLLAGLALLTKSPALILLAFVPLLLGVGYLLSALRGSEQRAGCFRLLLHGSLFLASVAVTFCALHPGMWSDPIATVRTAFTLADRHLTSVQRPVFFAGRMVMRPGPAFYPLVLLFRASPVAVIALIGGLILVRRLPPDRRFALLSLLLFVALFTAGLSLGTKKHARYLLPVFPPLSLAAAAAARAWLSRRLDGRTRPDMSALRLAGLLIILPQAVIALVFSAYPLTYENPLLGGRFVA